MATIAELEAELAALKKAKNAILTGGQSYSVGGRNFSRASLSDINKDILSIESRLSVARNNGCLTSSTPYFPGSM